MTSRSDGEFWGGMTLGAVVVCLIWVTSIKTMEGNCEKKHNTYDCKMVFEPVTEPRD